MAAAEFEIICTFLHFTSPHIMSVCLSVLLFFVNSIDALSDPHTRRDVPHRTKNSIINNISNFGSIKF